MALYAKGWLHNHRQEHREALVALQRSFELDPSRTGLPFELGFTHNALGEHEAAIAVLRSAIEREPNNSLLQREMAYSYMQLKDTANARVHLERGLELCPAEKAEQRAELAWNLAVVCRDAGDDEAFQRWVQLAWTLAPGDSEIHRIMSSVLEGLQPPAAPDAEDGAA